MYVFPRFCENASHKTVEMQICSWPKKLSKSAKCDIDAIFGDYDYDNGT